jgi:hypothetical protein
VRWRLPWQRLRRARWAVPGWFTPGWGMLGRAMFGCGALWITGPARAAEAPPIQAQIEWQAAACGKSGDFAARVSRRTRHVRFSASAPQLRLRVRIEPSAGALRAEVALESPGKPTVVRRIESPDCNDALDALALVVAIGIDQRWRELRAARPSPRPRQPVRAQPPPDPEGAARGPGEALLELPAVTLSLAPPVPVVAAPVPAPAAPAPPSPAALPQPAPLYWAAGAAGRLTSGVAPESLLGGEVWLRAGWERSSLWSPELGVRFLLERSRDFQRPEGQADFTLGAAALELCPLRLGGRRLRLQPCAISSFGWLRAVGHETFRANTRTSPWTSVGGGVQLLALLGVIALRVDAGAGHPLRRDRYRFEPSDCAATECVAPAFHRVAPVVWSVAVGAGLSVP